MYMYHVKHMLELNRSASTTTKQESSKPTTSRSGNKVSTASGKTADADRKGSDGHTFTFKCRCCQGTYAKLEHCDTFRAATYSLQDRKIWTDSTIVLAFLNNTKSRYNVFVANKINDILELSSTEQWRNVPTAQNPADLASRGVNVNDLDRLQFWLKGPVFLEQ